MVKIALAEAHTHTHTTTRVPMCTIGTIELLLSTRLSHLLCLHNLFKTYNHCLYVSEVLFLLHI